jgi:hypothetical protein
VESSLLGAGSFQNLSFSCKSSVRRLAELLSDASMWHNIEITGDDGDAEGDDKGQKKLFIGYTCSRNKGFKSKTEFKLNSPRAKLR